MARDRKRAKQRRDRRGATAGGRVHAPPPSQPVRGDVPGSLDHASSDVDEFDAALVTGAGGVPLPADTNGALDDSALEERAREDSALAEGASTERQRVQGDSGDNQLQAPALASGGSSGGAGRGGGVLAAGEEARPSGAPLRGGNRALGFLRASWAELQRVAWPDRRQVTQATAVVLGFVAIAGAYLGIADYVAKEIVEFIL